jgi:hypothetical protein
MGDVEYYADLMQMYEARTVNSNKIFPNALL